MVIAICMGSLMVSQCPTFLSLQYICGKALWQAVWSMQWLVTCDVLMFA